MIRIAIVDDEKDMLDMICQVLRQSINEDKEVKICRYTSGEAFLSEMDRGQTFDILFTDIQMSEISGIEVGKKIYSTWPQIYIIFITSYTEYAAESYAIEAYQYILKQDLEYRLPVVATRLITKIKQDNKQYRIMKTDSGKEKIYYKDIIYIYKLKSSKYVHFITLSGEYRERREYRERTTLQQVYEELGREPFLMVERAYIVNALHISKLCGDTIYLEGDDQVKISRAKLPEIKRQINRYWGE